MSSLKIFLFRTRTSNTLILTCVLVILTHTVQCQQPKQKDSFCLSQNPLIRVLSHHNVMVYDNPKASGSDTCGSEWKQHQTCCKANSLLEYAKQDVEIVGRKLYQLKKAANRLPDFIKKYDRLISKAVAENNAGYVQGLRDELTAVRNALTAVFHNETTAQVSQTNCVNRMLEIKTNSLCYTCSGRSAHFFLKGLALMGTDDCHKTIDKCVSHWHRTVLLVNALELAQKLHSRLRAIIPEQEILYIDAKDLGQLQNWVGSPQIRATVKHCADNLDSCSESSQKLLCEAFIWLRPKYFGKKEPKHEPASQTSNAEMADKPKVSHSAAVWALGKSRLLTAGKKSDEGQSVCLDIQQDIQVVRCKQTETGSVPMTFSGNILLGNNESKKGSHQLPADTESYGNQP